jgi:hypothetical protein
MTTLWRPRPSWAPKAISVRGALPPPGSEAMSRAKGSRRNLGGAATSDGMATGEGSQREITGVGCIVAGSRTAHSTVEAMEGNNTVQGRERPAKVTLESARNQTQH